MIAFYSIKPEYSAKILSGEKKYELRKRLPSVETNYIIIYATQPIGEIVGYAKIKAFHKKSINQLWKIVSQESGISKSGYMQYFRGYNEACALELYDVKRFARPFPVNEFYQNATIPQSFCYIEKRDFMRIKKRKLIAV